MNELAERTRTPKPPRLSHLVAVLLELAIVGVLAAHHSVAGLVLSAAYFYFSATCALVRPE